MNHLTTALLMNANEIHYSPNRNVSTPSAVHSLPHLTFKYKLSQFFRINSNQWLAMQKFPCAAGLEIADCVTKGIIKAEQRGFLLQSAGKSHHGAFPQDVVPMAYPTFWGALAMLC